MAQPSTGGGFDAELSHEWTRLAVALAATALEIDADTAVQRCGYHSRTDFSDRYKGMRIADGFSLFLALGWAVFGLLWILVPFAIFGIKGLLREMLAEQKQTNEILRRAHGASTPLDMQDSQPFRPVRYP
jgi:hypothetical protein